MAYSHASRDLRNRNDIYCFIPDPQGYSIPKREYGTSPDLSGYLKAAGWNASYFRPHAYFVTADSYRTGNMNFGRTSKQLYNHNYSNHAGCNSGVREYKSVTGYKPASRLESKLFLN